MPMSQSRVPAAMRAGAIDLADGTWSSFVALQHHRAARVFSLTEHARPPSVLLFSRRIWDEHEAAARREAEAAGVLVVSDIDTDAFARALAPFHPIVVPDAWLRSMIERIEAERAR